MRSNVEIRKYVDDHLTAYYVQITKAMEEGRPWEEMNAARGALLDALNFIDGEEQCHENSVQFMKALMKEAHRKLVETAKQAVQYVALGHMMKKDLAVEFGVPEEETEYLLAMVCDDLCRKIK